MNREPEDNATASKPRRRGPLRLGFSTGAAAAAAAQAALRELLGLPCPEQVFVPLPNGEMLPIALRAHGRLGSSGQAEVIKDAGDDPDVTHGEVIGVRAGWLNSGGGKEVIVIAGGEGVGRVTRPGLPVAVGEPAVNPTPRRMLRQSLHLAWDEAQRPGPLRIGVEVYVPRGEDLARRTLNPRLGILGGISILGTTGLVKPFSHDAYRATILASLRVAMAMGLDRVVFSTGGKSEGFMQARLNDWPPEAFVQMGDYVRFALKVAARLGFNHIRVAAFFGKAVKIAQGLGHTHASRGMVDLRFLGRLTGELCGDAALARDIAQANTARQALEMLTLARAGAVVAAVGQKMLAALQGHAGPGASVAATIMDFDGAVLWQA